MLLLMYCTTRKERSVGMVCMVYLDTEILNTFTNVLYYKEGKECGYGVYGIPGCGDLKYFY